MNPWQIKGSEDAKPLASICRPSLLFVQLVGTRPSTVDGKHLRARYELSAKPFRPGLSGLGGGSTDSPVVVEFDLEGALQLNWPGTLHLVGGDPETTYDVRTTLVDAPFLLTWHPLTAHVEGQTYEIPEYHSRIRSAALVAYTLAGNKGWLDHQPIPVCGGGTLSLPVAGQTIITDWLG